MRICLKKKKSSDQPERCIQVKSITWRWPGLLAFLFASVLQGNPPTVSLQDCGCHHKYGLKSTRGLGLALLAQNDVQKDATHNPAEKHTVVVQCKYFK